MRILFDQGTPVPLRDVLVGHEIATAHELGWASLANGDLLRRAEGAAFDVMITTDQNLKYQQNLSTRRIAIVVLLTTSWPLIRTRTGEVVEAVARLTPGAYVEIPFPPPGFARQER